MFGLHTYHTWRVVTMFDGQTSFTITLSQNFILNVTLVLIHTLTERNPRTHTHTH